MPCEVRLTRSSRLSAWGFRLTGGVTFNMPITVFEVQEGGFADRAGIRVGDVLIEINGKRTVKLTLKEANTIVDSLESMDLVVNNLLDQEASEELEAKMTDEPEEEELQLKHSEINQLDLPPPRPAPLPDQAQRKCWHPVMLDTNPAPIIEETTGDEEAPHKKILRNFRQAMSDKNLNPSPENPPLEKPPPPPNDFVADDDEAELSVEEQLRLMQRQLAALANLPEILKKSLAAVNTKICKLLPPEPDIDDELEYDVSEHVEDDYTADERSYEYELSREGSPDIESKTEPITETIETEESLRETEPESEPEPEPEPIPTEEELLKIEKLRKMEQLNKAWPWSNQIKPVYKMSDRYSVPHSKIFDNTIEKIESKIVLRKFPFVDTS